MNGLQVAFQATLAKDAELRFLPNGTPLLSFSAAIFDAKRADGAPTEWIRCSIFGELADQLEGRLTKSTAVYCEGRVKLNSYTDAAGVERSGLAATVWVCQPMGQIGKKAPKRRDVDEYRTAFQPRRESA